MENSETSPQAEAVADSPSIKGLLALDDAGLMEVFGFDKQLAQLKERLTAADKLQGKARKEVELKLQEQLTPHVSPDSMRWWIEDAERHAKQSPKDAMDDDCPSSVL